MKKRLLAIVFSLFAVYAAIWAQSGYCGDPNVNGGKDVTWEFEYNTLIISGTGDMASWDHLDSRPWASFANSIGEVIIDGVTSVGTGAFAKCENLKYVYGNFKSIGDGAFWGCINLKIDPPIIASADWIGVRAFAECHSLEGFDESEYGGGHSTLYLTASCVGHEAFMACPKIDRVDLIGENQEIDRGAFYGCTGLKTLVVGTGVKSIGDEAFAGCENLVKVEIEAPVPPVLGENAFTGIHPDVEFIIDENLGVEVMNAYANSDWAKYFDVLSTTVVSGYCGDPNVNEGKDVTWNLSLGGVLTISGVGAMEDCGYVRVVGGWGFDRSPWCGDDRVTSVVVKEGITNIGDGAFRECVKIESVELPTSCTIIGDSAFYCCSSLKTIVIPEGVTSIGNDAFVACSSLKSIVIPNSVTTIGDCAFLACFSLESVNIPENVTFIDKATFMECHSLTSIVIPAGVSCIGGDAFACCSNLSVVTCLNPVPPTIEHESAFWGISPTAILRVPDVEAYKASDWAKYFPTIVDLDMDITAINGVEAEQMKSTTIYDLSGRRVHTPVKGRIYVVNNKVVMW